MNKITFVSCIFDIYEDNNVFGINKTRENRIRFFEKLIALTNINVALYSCPKYEPLIRPILEKYKNVKLIKVLSLEDLIFYKKIKKYQLKNNIKLNLPNKRSLSKDTLNYMILMNSKIQFIRNAININVWNTYYFAWIDFSIFYIKINSNIINTLSNLNNSNIIPESEFIISPSCPYAKSNGNYIDKPIWRFLGGFFIGDINSLKKLSDIYYNNIEVFFDKYKYIVWEVNYLIWLEENGYINIKKYFCTFDSIFGNQLIKIIKKYIKST